MPCRSTKAPRWEVLGREGASDIPSPNSFPAPSSPCLDTH